MKIVTIVACLALAVFAAGCASTTYSAFEGGDIIQGTGGTKKTLDGMDIWSNGSPPRKFRVIGIIDDTRRQSLINMIGYEQELVKKAKEAGGDAILILDARSEIVGYRNSGHSGTARTTGTVSNGSYQSQTSYQSYGSTTSAVREKTTKAAVIRYQD